MSISTIYLRIKGPTSEESSLEAFGSFRYSIQSTIRPTESENIPEIVVSLKTYDLGGNDDLRSKFHCLISGRNADGSHGSTPAHTRVHQRLIDAIHEASSRTANKLYLAVSGQGGMPSDKVQNGLWTYFTEKSQVGTDLLRINVLTKQKEMDCNAKNEQSEEEARYTQTWVETSPARFDRLFRTYLTKELVSEVNELEWREGRVSGTVSHPTILGDEGGTVWLRFGRRVTETTERESAGKIKSELVVSSIPLLAVSELDLNDLKRDWDAVGNEQGQV